MKANLSYITSAWGAFVVTLLQIFVFYYLWMTIYQDKTLLHGVDMSQMSTYIILSRILYTQVTWGVIDMMGEMIHTGEIQMELLRPVDFQLAMCIGRLGDFIAFGSITAIPALVVSSMFIGLYLPHNPLTYLYFFISLAIAITIAFLIEFGISMLAFYTLNTWGLEILYEALISLFSGAIIPIVFFPKWLKIIVDYLPFKDILYTPISIYLGMVKGHQVFEAILIQLGWAVVLYGISRFFYNFSIKKITVQGG